MLSCVCGSVVLLCYGLLCPVCSVGALHGDKHQHERLQVMDKFKRNELRILVATDVAGTQICFLCVRRVGVG